MKILPATIVSGLLLAVPTGAQTIAQKVSQPKIQANQLIGQWYMGTMSGFDCELKISADQTLKVQFGGCFHRDPVITTRWQLQGDKIKFANKALDASLGSQLRVIRFKNHWVLMPEKPQEHQGSHPFSYNHCFWRNTMKNGLQLSKDAPA